MPRIPTDFASAMVAMRGEAGQRWIDELPQTIDDFARRWSLRVGPPFPNLSFNYVTSVERADGTPAVLKIGYPSDKAFRTELEALKLFAGQGIARLLEHDTERMVMLLERVVPGRSLLTVDDDERSIAIAAGVMQRLWRPVPADHPFPTIGDWGKGFQRLRRRFDGGTGPLSSGLVDRAEHLFAELAASQAPPMLLHGDLNHGNILSSNRADWLAIDPKGVVGEPAYETGVLLRNWLPDLLLLPNPADVLGRRVDRLAELLHVDRIRIRDWGIAQAVLSAWWCIEDNSSCADDAMTCAELLTSLPD